MPTEPLLFAALVASMALVFWLSRPAPPRRRRRPPTANRCEPAPGADCEGSDAD